MANVHFNKDGFLRTAVHEGKIARYSGKSIDACPYRGGVVETSWKQGFNDPSTEV